jgi:N4-gp56 family major capsid protein
MPNDVLFTDEFIPVMEMPLHAEPLPQYIFHQFCMEDNTLMSNPGDTVRIIGPTWQPPVSNPRTDRKLSSLSDRVSDNATRTIDENKQEMTIQEFLTPQAIVLREFDEKRSIHDLAGMVGANLAEDYFNWQDQIIRDCFYDSGFQRNVAGKQSYALTTADLISFDQLNITGAIMKNRHIPTFPDGKYICIIDPNTEATLFNEQKVLDATTRAYGAQAFVFKGEIGPIGHLRFVVSNHVEPVNVGQSGTTINGSQAVIFGSGLFGQFPLGTADELISSDRMKWLGGNGAGPVVKVNAMPVEVRPHEVTDYGRFREVIWIEYSEYRVLDPNPTNATGGAGKVVGTDSRFIQKMYGATALSAAV